MQNVQSKQKQANYQEEKEVHQLLDATQKQLQEYKSHLHRMIDQIQIDQVGMNLQGRIGISVVYAFPDELITWAKDLLLTGELVAPKPYAPLTDVSLIDAK